MASFYQFSLRAANSIRPLDMAAVTHIAARLDVVGTARAKRGNAADSPAFPQNAGHGLEAYAATIGAANGYGCLPQRNSNRSA